MSLPFADSFDSVAAPALPSGYNATGSGWATTTSDKVSSPNSATISTLSTTKAYLVWGTPDGNGGDVALRVNLRDFSSVRPGTVGLVARGSASTLDGTTSQYELGINWNTGQLKLARVNSGAETTLATVSIVGGWDQWDALTWAIQGSNHDVKLQRSSDGEWLTPGGSWSSTQQSTIHNHTDPSPLAGSGYFGLFSAAGASSTHQGWWDDLSAAAPGTAMALVEGHDALSAAGSFRSSATLAKAEGRDAPSLRGAETLGSLAGVEGRDTPSIGAGQGSATVAAAERRDTPAFVGRTPNAILTVKEGSDVPAISAFFEPVGTIAAAESPDIPGLVGLFRRGVLAATERHDTASILGHFGASGSIVASERHDAAAIAGLACHAALAIAEARDRAAIPAVAAGIPPYFKVMEQRDIPLFLGGLTTVQYHVYMSPASGAPIDYDTPVATVATPTSWDPPAFACPGTWKFGVRAFDAFGEEQNIDCVVTIVFDANGIDISDRPNPPTGLRAFPVGPGAIRIEWYYPPTTGPKAPAAFNVYAAPGILFNYGTPAASVPFSAGLFNAFSTTLSGLAPGTPYLVGVRATNPGGEEANTSTVIAEPGGGGPLAVVGLTAVATA